jgi:SPP1 family predicted phage head-tail adaptor
MQAARLRHRVTFEQFVSELDSDGNEVGLWQPAFDRPLSAEIWPMSGRELLAAEAVASKLSTRITVRWRREFKASMRALHRGAVYNVEAVVPDPKSGVGYCTLLCSSGVNEG